MGLHARTAQVFRVLAEVGRSSLSLSLSPVASSVPTSIGQVPQEVMVMLPPTKRFFRLQCQGRKVSQPRSNGDRTRQNCSLTSLSC